jgi:hypothetical protein
MRVTCQEAQEEAHTMLNQMQVSTVIHSLSALLEHPDFQKGIEFGRDMYYDLEYESMLTEEEMITLVEDELSRRARRRDARNAQLMDDKPLPFLLHLGVVVGVIDQALAAQTQ